MVWVAIIKQDKSNFAEIGLKSAATADEDSSVNQCSHKIDFSLHRAKKIPMQVLAGKGGFRRHRVIHPVIRFSTRTSRNGREELSSFSNMKRNEK